MSKTIHLRSRLLARILLPSLLLLLLISSLFTYSTLNDVLRQEIQIHQTYAKQVAAHTYTVAASGNLELLQQIAQTSLEHPAVRAVTFYDPQGEVLAHAGPLLPPLTPETKLLDTQTKGFFSLRQDITVLPISPFYMQVNSNNSATSSEPTAGWIQLQFTYDSILLYNYRNTVINVLITLLLLALIYLAITHTSEELARALKKIRQQIQSPDTRELHCDSKVAEIETLVQAANQLLKQQRHTTTSYQQQLEQVESDLNSTIEAIEIKNIELDIARKEAISNNRIKSEFLANTSHEIRTPLNSIIGFSSMLLKSQLTRQQRDHLQTIYEASQNLLLIINDILDLSKIEANRFVLNNDSFRPRQVVEETLQAMASTAHIKKIELACAIYSDVPEFLHGDAARIKQVLTNLVGNAIKFSQDGTIAVRLSLEENLDRDVVVKFEVQDQGVGLPNGQQHVIFQPFSQIDNSLTREHTGSGLGLTICQRLIQQMGGELDYWSEEGKTRFWFTVRLALAPPPANYQPPVYPWQPQRVWLCDNTTLNLHTSAHLLSSLNCDVRQFDQFSALVQHLQQQPAPDIAIVNIPVNADRAFLDAFNQCIAQYPALHWVAALPTNIAPEQLIDTANLWTSTKPPTHARFTAVLSDIYNASHSDVDIVSGLPEIAYMRDLNILLVDDTPSNTKLISALLEPYGCHIVTACNGDEALARVRERKDFNLIIMDVQMPVMDGITASQHIRALEQQQQRRPVPIIALTAYAQQEQRQQTERAGMNDFLSKPIDEIQLVSCIERWAVQAPAWQPATATPEPTTDNAIFNARLALSRCSNKLPIALEMQANFLAQWPTEVRELRQAFDNEHYDQAQAIAHKIHGACCYCGFPALLTACKQLDKSLREKQLADMQTAYQQFNDAVAALEQWLMNNNPNQLLAEA